MQTLRAKMNDEQFPGIEECIRRMKSGVATLEEDGFWWLEPTGTAHLDRYLEELYQSSGIFRSYLIELIGNSTSPKAISMLVKLMNSGVKQDSEDAQLALWNMGDDSGKGFVVEYYDGACEFTDYLREDVREYKTKL